MAFIHPPAIPPKSRRITCLVASERGEMIAAGRGDGVVELWDGNDGTRIRELKVHTSEVRQIHVLAGGRILIVRGWPNDLMLVESDSGSRIETLGGKYATMTPDDDHLVLVDQKKRVFVRDVKSGRLGEPRPILDLDATWRHFSSDGQWLVTRASSGVCSVSSTKTGEVLFYSRFEIRGAIRMVTPGLQMLVEDGATLGVVDLRSGELIRRLEGTPLESRWVAASADGQHLLSGSNAAITIWSINGGDAVTIVRPRRLPSSSLTHVTFMDGGRFVLTTGLDTHLDIWSVDTGSRVASFAADSSILSAITQQKSIVVGTDLGFVHLLRLEETRDYYAGPRARN